MIGFKIKLIYLGSTTVGIICDILNRVGIPVVSCPIVNSLPLFEDRLIRHVLQSESVYDSCYDHACGGPSPILLYLEKSHQITNN